MLDRAQPPAWTVTSAKVSELPSNGSAVPATGDTKANKAPAAAQAEVPAASVRLITRVTASSVLKPQATQSEGIIRYEAGNAIDGKLNTAWVSSGDRNPVGEWLRIEFNSPVRFSAVRIFGSYGKNQDMFQKNGRIKALRMTLSPDESITLKFNDVMDFNRFEFKTPKVSRSIRFEILETFPGSKYRDAPITEIVFE